jgi:multiple sugar transport system permease protein
MSRSTRRASSSSGGRSGGRATDAAYILGQAVLVLLFIFPLLWVLSLSLKTAPETLQSPPGLLPSSPQWGNYTHVLDTTPIGRYLLNSLILVVASVAGALALGVPTAYALSRLVFPARRSFTRGLLAAQLISPLIIAVPLYRLFVALHLVNNYLGLVLVYIAIIAPFLTWFLKSYLDTVPISLDEAALVDGCTRRSAMLRVVLPSAMPGIASAAILGAVTSWSQFAIPFILLDDRDLFPVSVGVVNLQATAGEITTQYLAAGSVLAVAPVVVLFVLLQRHIVGALTSGAVKG